MNGRANSAVKLRWIYFSESPHMKSSTPRTQKQTLRKLDRYISMDHPMAKDVKKRNRIKSEEDSDKFGSRNRSFFFSV